MSAIAESGFLVYELYFLVIHCTSISELSFSLLQGASIDLLLTSHLESVFNNRGLNYEKFRMATVIINKEIVVLSNPPNHHTSVPRDGLFFNPTSFTYLPFQNMFFNAGFFPDNERSVTYGSMSVYKEKEIRAHFPIEPLKVDLLGSSNITSVAAQQIIKRLYLDHPFKVYCLLENDVQVLFTIDLPMITDSGDFKLAIAPYIAQDWIYKEDSILALALYNKFKSIWNSKGECIQWDSDYAELYSKVFDTKSFQKPLVCLPSNIDTFHSLIPSAHFPSLTSNCTELLVAHYGMDGKVKSSSHKIKQCFLFA